MWKTVRLGDIAKLYQPKTISKKEMADDGDYLVYGANGIIGRYHQFNHSTPQLIIGCRGSCGEVHLTRGKCWITGNAMVIQPNDEVLNEYLRYFLLQPNILRETISGTAQPQITRKSLSPVELQIPPLAEQKRIVERLDKAFSDIDKAIATAEAKEGEVERLKASTLSAMLNRGAHSGTSITDDEEDSVMWKKMPFESCIKKIKTPPKIPKKLYMETGEYPVVSQEAVHISGYHSDLSKVFRVEKPVVIFGDHTRVCKYVDFDFIVGADGVKIFLPDEGVNPKYFYYFILANTPVGKGYARHYRFLKQLTVPLPPPAEQKRIVARLDKAFAEIEIVDGKTQSCVEKYAALKASILKQELTPSEAV